MTSDWANGNQVKDIMMNQIGVYGYYLANASENTISGGFISGGPNNMTVIRSVGKSSQVATQRIVQFPSLSLSLVRCRCLAPQIACSTISSP